MLWQNLIGNAVKFSRPGETPRIDIEFESSDDPAAPDQWRFSVSDNGIGIGDEFVDKVFVIFQRLHGRDAYAGTGIGLALCKKIVEYHGGTIWIDVLRRRHPVLFHAPRCMRSSPDGRGRNTRMSSDARPIDVLLVEDDPATS